VDAAAAAADAAALTAATAGDLTSTKEGRRGFATAPLLFPSVQKVFNDCAVILSLSKETALWFAGARARYTCLMATKQFTTEEAKGIGDTIGVDWAETDLEQFRLGLSVELEHGKEDPRTNVTNDDPLLTGKIAWAHLNEIPDYYTRLLKMEHEASS